MAVVFEKVFYTPPFGSETEITSLINIQNQRGLDLKSGKTDLLLNNSLFRDKNGGETIFVEDGLIEIYADYNPITKSSDQLLLSGQIREVAPRMSSGGSQMKLTVADKTVLLLGGLWSKDYSNMTPDNIIKSVIAQVAQGAVTTSNVVTTTTSGSSFPSITTSKVFKPVYEWISDLSQPDITGEDRAYMFYVDKDNDLHWFYPSQTSSGNIVEGEDEIYNWNMKKDADSVVNMIIFNAGTDLNGNGVLWYYWDATSKSSTLHMKYQPMIDLSKDVFEAEISANNLTESSTGTIPYKGKLYDAVTSGTTSWGTSFSTLDDYKDKFRQRLKDLGTIEAQKITTRFGKLLWSGSISIKGTNVYTAGDLITFTSNTLGLQNYLLRIVDVTQSIGKNGWITTLEVKEDEEAILAS